MPLFDVWTPHTQNWRSASTTIFDSYNKCTLTFKIAFFVVVLTMQISSSLKSSRRFQPVAFSTTTTTKQKNYSNRRSLIFTFPYNVIYMFRNVCLALLLSLITGTIFYHVRLGREQEWVWDRIMFYHCLLAIVPVPLYLIQMNDGKLFYFFCRNIF